MSEETVKDTRQVREEERLDVDALHAYLKGVAPEFAERPALEQFPGGHSNLTYLLKWRGRELVLRRPPLGPVVKSGHDMSREVRFLRALEEAGFRAAPRV
ncbi:MAG: phosphotransferase, partial [Candidatus Methylomirabilis sp.]|nr:phosphotransferase [Deltaproteobacteria bacterium]